MEIVSLCPFTTVALPWRTNADHWQATVCVKATFDLVHGGEAKLAATQIAAHEDIPWDRSPHASLYAPSDFVPFKARADVLLVGSARAGAGGMVETLPVRLQVGELVKTLRVTGDRVWTMTREGLRPSKPRPFADMPLRFERAATGGDNPIGIHPRHAAEGAPLPNIELDEGAATAGFGPLPPAWRAARAQLSQEAFAWSQRPALGPAPRGFDAAFFNAAPSEQQVEQIRPGAAIVLGNLHPYAPHFESRLPSVRPRVWSIPPGAVASEISLRVDTLWIDADRALAVVSWRGVAAVTAGDPRAWGRLLVAAQEPGQTLRYQDLAERAGIEQPKTLGGLAGVPLAFPLDDELTDDAGRTQTMKAVTVLANVLPFAGGAAAPPAPAREQGAIPGAPFRTPPTASEALPPAPAPRVAQPRIEDHETLPLGFEMPPEIARLAGMPFAPRLRPEAAQPPPPEVTQPAPPARIEEMGFEPRPPPEPARPTPPPPPLLGPLAHAANTPVPPSSDTATAPAIPAASPPEEPSPAPPQPAPPAPLVPDEVSLEQSAAVAAQLDHDPTRAADVLARYALTEDAWKAAAQRWEAAVRKETARGKTALLGAYDAAYVAELEKERGPILPEEYARLLVSAERVETDETLDALRLPRVARMRVARVWMKRIAADTTLAAEVRRALAAARAA